MDRAGEVPKIPIMFPVITPDLHTRWARMVPFAVIGALGIIGGGVAAAVTGPTDWDQGSWFAAFVVLVVGVAQIGLGVGQAALGAEVPTKVTVAAQVATWNVGCAFVIAGTLASSPVVATLGSIIVLVCLVMAGKIALGHSGLDGSARVWLGLYRLLLAVLVVSTPIGIALSWIRN